MPTQNNDQIKAYKEACLKYQKYLEGSIQTDLNKMNMDKLAQYIVHENAGVSKPYSELITCLDEIDYDSQSYDRLSDSSNRIGMRTLVSKIHDLERLNEKDPIEKKSTTNTNAVKVTQYAVGENKKVDLEDTSIINDTQFDSIIKALQKYTNVRELRDALKHNNVDGFTEMLTPTLRDSLIEHRSTGFISGLFSMVKDSEGATFVKAIDKITNDPKYQPEVRGPSLDR